MPQYVIEEYQQKGVQPRLVDTYKGMSIFEVPKTAVVADDIDYNFNGDIAADSYHKTDIDIKLLKELGVGFSLKKFIQNHKKTFVFGI